MSYKNTSFIRVRYGETDQMGYVYYGNYALYYEVGRVEALRALGTSYKDLEAQGILLPVLTVTSSYHRAARYDDLLEVITYVDSVPSARIVFRYEIYNETKILIHTAEVTLVFVSALTQKPTKCPENIRLALEKLINC